MKFDELLESFNRYKLKYRGTRKNYKINDPNPYVLALDDKYNVDRRGLSILGINLNYYDGDTSNIIKKINKIDNEKFKNFNLRLKLNRLRMNKDDFENFKIEKKKERYRNFIKNFPYLGNFIRRYKLSGITSKKRKYFEY